MKLKNKIIIIAVAVLLAVFAVVVAIQIFGNKGVEVKYPKGFIEITAENINDNGEFIKALGYTEESFLNHLNNNGIISFAANKDNSSQFTLSCRTTDLSAELKDISQASDNELESISNALLKGGHSAIWRLGGRTYLEVTATVKGEQSYTSRQYITVVGGKYYSLNYYGSASEITTADEKLIESTLETLSIPNESSFKEDLSNVDSVRIFYMILTAAVGVAGVVVIVLLSGSLIRDYLKKRRSNEGDSLQIKRRK